MCFLRWGVQFIDPKSTDFRSSSDDILEAPGAYNHLPFVYWSEFDQVYSSGSAAGPAHGRFHEIVTMVDYKRVFACVHVFQEEMHWKGLLGMMLMARTRTWLECVLHTSLVFPVAQGANSAKSCPSLSWTTRIGTPFTTHQ